MKAYTHWMAMHNQCRICGPWFFYILLFLLYEVPIFIFAIFGIIQFGIKDGRLSGLFHSAKWYLSSVARKPGEEIQYRGDRKDKPCTGPWAEETLDI